jgi:hypothetical protein
LERLGVRHALTGRAGRRRNSLWPFQHTPLGRWQASELLSSLLQGRAECDAGKCSRTVQTSLPVPATPGFDAAAVRRAVVFALSMEL